METAHILFIQPFHPPDSAGAGIEALRRLEETICGAHQYRRAQSGNQVFYQKTGDSIAVIFFNDPEAAAHCALEVSRTLSDQNRIALRVGLHTGQVERVIAEDGSATARSEALQVAKDIMGFGEAGHILVSKEASDSLNRVANWARYLQEIGEVEGGGQDSLHLFNLHTGEVGNPAPPRGLRLKVRPIIVDVASAATAGSIAVTDPALSEQQTVLLDADSLPAGDADYRLTVKQTFRDLLIHSVLGEGAMGAAYLASHPVLQMPLVIKTFKSTNRAGIFKEAHLAARVTSPNVVSVIDAGIEGNIPFVVQKYVDGIDLGELIRHVQEANWRLPVDLICRIAIDVAKGLHAIHQAGVIHRDVKPANLFLNGNGAAMVGDFGIAVDTEAEDGKKTISGTPIFMAPEQWQQRELGRYTDVYALGVTMHTLATGKFPFDGETLQELFNAHVNQPYQPPPAAEPSEAYLFSVIERTLRKNPDERFATADQLARVLRVVAEPPPKYVGTDQDEARIGDLHVALSAGNIAECEADVIVNSSGVQLTMNVGVAAALRQAAGPSVEEQALRHAPASMGDVIWTDAGNLRARWVAHAAAALRGAVCLQRCTLRALLGAEMRQAKSAVFPSLGTGIGDVPMDLAAKLMLEAIGTFATFQPRHVRSIRIVLRRESTLARWRAIMNSM
ncbi:MAG TPA: protein kinase [Blastocatellia bacterium]|nr:protein kinase [Blastocatellia bacterium]